MTGSEVNESVEQFHTRMMITKTEATKRELTSRLILATVIATFFVSIYISLVLQVKDAFFKSFLVIVTDFIVLIAAVIITKDCHKMVATVKQLKEMKTKQAMGEAHG